MTKTQKKNAAQILRVELARLLGVGDRLAIQIFGDVLTRELSCFVSFQELLDQAAHGYRPTLRERDDARKAVLADLYDYSQAALGRDIQAYRGS